MTYMLLLNCALKLVEEIILYYDARSKKQKKKWIQHVNRMPRNRLPRVMKHYSPTGKRNHGRPLKRLLDR